MTDRKQQVWNDTFANRPRLNVTTRGTQPSWKRSGDGAQHFSAYANSGSISITAEEHAYGENGRTTTKSVMLTLDKGALIELRELINSALKDQ